MDTYSYERRPRVGEKRHKYILENTLYTNDTHLSHFSFFNGEEGDHQLKA